MRKEWIVQTITEGQDHTMSGGTEHCKKILADTDKEAIKKYHTIKQNGPGFDPYIILDCWEMKP